MNMGLVQGEADVQNSKAFVNYGELMQKKVDSGGGKTTSEGVKEEKVTQSDGAIDVAKTGDDTESTVADTDPAPK
tara:strand:- start:1520 stop:1744 length:225 start_codon:yes stop_codon:yes gene_type:complete